MKQFILLLIATLMLTGCSKGAEEATAPEVSATAEATATPEGESGYLDVVDDSFDTGAEATVEPTLAPTESDFRSLKWGMTFDDVVKIEGTGYRTSNDGNTITYARIREEGFPADAEYTFKDGVIVSATFYIQEKYDDLNQYMTDYEKLKNSFVSRFGAPTQEEESWANEQLKDKPDKRMEAVLAGALKYRTGWNTQTTAVKLVLSRRNNAVCIGIMYTPIEK